jgi:hypothetical protein
MKGFIIMKTKIFLLTMIAFIIAFTIVGCEFGKYPLILDSSVTSGAIRVDLNSPLPVQVTQTTDVSISELRDVTGESVDSMKFYNLTLFIENNTSPSAAGISGTISINGNALVTLTNVTLTEFQTERSIFDKNLTSKGFQYHAAGVMYLLNALKTQTPDMLTVSVTAGTNASSLHFDLKVKLYGQIFASTN